MLVNAVKLLYMYMIFTKDKNYVDVKKFVEMTEHYNEAVTQRSLSESKLSCGTKRKEYLLKQDLLTFNKHIYINES